MRQISFAEVMKWSLSSGKARSSNSSPSAAASRSRFFAGADLVKPGLVPVDEWRAEPGTTGKGNSAMWAGVGRKP